MKPVILFDHEIFGIQKFGGISRVYIELISRLSSYEEFKVAWHRGFHQDQYDISLFKEKLNYYFGAWVDGGIDFEKKIREQNYFSLQSFVKNISAPIDIFHTTYYDEKIIDLVNYKKLAITIHDMIPEILMGNESKFKSVIDGKRKLINSADIIFCVSKNTSSDLLNFYPDARSRVIITPNGNSLNALIPADLPEAVRNLEKPYLLYVGTRSKYKNFKILLSAFSREPLLRDLFSVVVFGGSGYFNKEEASYINNNNLSNVFKYINGDDHILKSLYLNAKSLIYTSNYEGFGLPVLEAAANRCGVVCTKTSSIPEIIGEHAIYFEPNNEEDLISKLLSLNKSESNSRILAAEEFVKKYNWEESTLIAVNAYRNLL